MQDKNRTKNHESNTEITSQSVEFRCCAPYTENICTGGPKNIEGSKTHNKITSSIKTIFFGQKKYGLKNLQKNIPFLMLFTTFFEKNFPSSIIYLKFHPHSTIITYGFWYHQRKNDKAQSS